jgi:hypothetical protein
MTPTTMVFRRELCIPCDLLFEASLNKEQSTTDYVVDLVDWLHEIHHYGCQHLKTASDRMEAHYNYLSSSMVFQEGDWL